MSFADPPSEGRTDATDATMTWTVERDGDQLWLHTRQQPRPKRITKPWILCVDDDLDFVEGLRMRLKSRGFEVVRAGRGTDGLRYAIEFSPAAILLDLCMPGGTGQDLLQKLKANDATRQIPTIIMTGLDQPGLKAQMLSAGAADLFRKPVSPDLLVEVVRHYTKQSSKS